MLIVSQQIGLKLDLILGFRLKLTFKFCVQVNVRYKN